MSHAVASLTPRAATRTFIRGRLPSKAARAKRDDSVGRGSGARVCIALMAGLVGVIAGCGATKEVDPSVTERRTASPTPPDESPATPTSERVDVTDEALERHARRVRARIARIAPDQAFHVVIEPPFVVIGDESAAMVRKRAEGTVRWAVDRLQDAYFPRQPDHVIEVWLFGTARSYRANTKAFFDDEPGTPYGYYSSTHRALIMNIATGGGTLVHEIVHPFMAANFPACPAWFNEGMGSLYEQSGQRNGQIIGRTNWRLAGLQDALRANTVPSFAVLTSTNDAQFYEQDPGSNYAQARYLLYYLQEKGLLRDYYRRFHENAERDPTGYQTLKELLGQPDMDAFFTVWRDYVLELEFH